MAVALPEPVAVAEPVALAVTEPVAVAVPEQAQLINSQLYRRSYYAVPHTYMAVEAGICQARG